MTKSEAPFVVAGVSKNKIPRAAVFKVEDVALAVKAARALNFKIGTAQTPEAIAVIKRVPDGATSVRQNKPLPRVRRPLYDKVCKLVQLSVLPPDES